MDLAKDISRIVAAFIGEVDQLTILPISQGIINQSFGLSCWQKNEPKQYFLQRLNTTVFTKPEQLMKNLELLNQHLAKTEYPYCLLQAILHKNNAYIYEDDAGNHWRLYDYIPNTVAFDQVTKEQQVADAARAMATFYQYTQDFSVETIKPSLVHFHQLDHYWELFWKTVDLDKYGRKTEVEDLLETIRANAWMVETYQQLDLPQRLIHGDPKLSNLLFSKQNGNIVAIIDWDTLMPGTILSDFGDMVRTYTNLQGEESADFSNIKIHVPYFETLVRSFLETSKTFLKKEEQEKLYFGALWISLEQSLRFLADYLNGDSYYKVTYAKQNLVRAKNQLHFLDSLLAYQKQGEALIKALV